MVDSTPLIGEAPAQGKIGHRVLCCCDSRKAVIILGLLALAANVAFLVAMAVPDSGIENTGWEPIVISAVSILIYMSVVGGALRYHTCAVTICWILELLSLVLYIVGCALTDWSALVGEEKSSTIGYFAAGITVKCFGVYVFGTFLREVKSGIMSPATHSREKYSCCCNV